MLWILASNCCLVARSYLILLWPSWTVDSQVPQPMGFPREEYQRGLPFPPPGDLPDPGTKPTSPALVGGFLTAASGEGSQLHSGPRRHNGEEPACQAGDTGLTPRLGRSPGVGNDNLLRYSCQENYTGRGTWWATVHRVAKESSTAERAKHTHTDSGPGPASELCRGCLGQVGAAESYRRARRDPWAARESRVEGWNPRPVTRKTLHVKTWNWEGVYPTAIRISRPPVLLPPISLSHFVRVVFQNCSSNVVAPLVKTIGWFLCPWGMTSAIRLILKAL